MPGGRSGGARPGRHPFALVPCASSCTRTVAALMVAEKKAEDDDARDVLDGVVTNALAGLNRRKRDRHFARRKELIFWMMAPPAAELRDVAVAGSTRRSGIMSSCARVGAEMLARRRSAARGADRERAGRVFVAGALWSGPRVRAGSLRRGLSPHVQPCDRPDLRRGSPRRSSRAISYMGGPLRGRCSSAELPVAVVTGSRGSFFCASARSCEGPGRTRLAAEESRCPTRARCFGRQK